MEYNLYGSDLTVICSEMMDNLTRHLTNNRTYIYIYIYNVQNGEG